MRPMISRALLVASLIQGSFVLAGSLATSALAATDKITFTNKIENGKKVWEPSTASVKAGDKVEITLINTLADPHGFEIKDLGQKVVVGPKETKTLTFDATKAGTFKFNCQLHPAHVGGEITVK